VVPEVDDLQPFQPHAGTLSRPAILPVGDRRSCRSE
jgi:hypothetical protein